MTSTPDFITGPADKLQQIARYQAEIAHMKRLIAEKESEIAAKEAAERPGN